jgi:acylphosphatase
MTTTYELIIYGKVQHVGFRDRIENIGRGLGISGVVYNYKDGTVRILANFDDEEIKELFKRNIKALSKKDKLIEIERIEERELNTYIDFPEGINRISADDILELNKKLDEGVKYIKLIFEELEGHTKILVKLDEKLDIHTKILERIDSKLDNVDEKLDKLDKKLSSIDKKLDTHTELLTQMNEKLDKLNETQLKMIEILGKIEKKL